jgi:uncharacterized protein
VDVLRAIALLGIVITHAEMGFLAGPPPTQDFMRFGPADVAVHRWIAILVESKFFSIFSFLFGLSFAIQLDRARQKGAAFSARFSWRLTLLLLIGMAHQVLFNGDILMIYAVLGLLLIPLGKIRTGVLLAVALLLVLNTPALVQGMARIASPPPASEQKQASAKLGEIFTVGGQALYAATKSGSIADIARVNYTHGLEMKWVFQWFSGRLWITLGCFLLGLCAGRAGVFRESESSRRFFGRLFAIAGGIAFVSTVLVMQYRPSSPLTGVLLQFASNLQKVSLAAVYVSAITLVFWNRPRGMLLQLAPLGRMGLTTYLMQSVFLAAVFYGIGFGVMGEIGSAAAAALGVGIFVLQVFIARWWLTRMSMGPVEWLWRSATYGRWQRQIVGAR